MISKILREAKKILSDQTKYVTGTWAVDKNDEPCAPAGKRAVRWDLEGSLFKASHDLGHGPDEATKAIELALAVVKEGRKLFGIGSKTFGHITTSLNIAIVKSEAA